MQELPDTFVLVAIMILPEFVRERFKDKGVPIEATARFEQRVPRLVAGTNRCRAARPPWDPHFEINCMLVRIGSTR
ncbi:hypothetical protein V7S43_010354 [Phytophthora oleae]|uniref:Phosphoribulokinase/uridine kinase domain-containing protein n=1 Tax=Phytophthora oleae TaxID=2107226 RepID=A0ABD3FE67_9STRA